jgi:predicted  nucleic acid-binding Zn-ribbon protein
MSTLLDDLGALLALQEVDSRIFRAKGQLAALDTGVSVVRAYNAQKAEALALRAAAQREQAAQKDAELKLLAIEEKIKQVNKTLYGGTIQSSRELGNLEKEIEMLGRQKDTAEEAVLIAMEAASQAGALADAAEAQQETLAGEYRAINATHKRRTAALTAELAALEPERAAAAAQVGDTALLARYDTIRGKKSNGVGIAPLAKDEVCGGCSTRINSTLALDARTGLAAQVCEYCVRLLAPV